MSSHFSIETKQDVFECSRAVRHFAIDFGLSDCDSSLLAIAVSEAATNTVRYAKEGKVHISYTANKLGLEIEVSDAGKGIQNIEKCLEDGYTTSKTSLGLGLGSIQRSIDEFIITKSDKTGISLLLRKYINTPLHDSAEVSIKKESEHFNGDGTIICHYDGDKSLFVVLDAAGAGLKASQAMKYVQNIILKNIRLELDDLLTLCHESLSLSEHTRAVELAIFRTKPKEFEYVILGNTFIKSYPAYSFISQQGSLGLSFSQSIQVVTNTLEEEFCIALCSDGIDREFTLSSLYEESTALVLATGIFNHYNNDDDSSVIVVKKAS